MELIEMDSITQKQIVYLRNNNNVGIEFEYALFYLLNTEVNRSKFLKEVIHYHQDRERILSIIAATKNLNDLIAKLKTLSWIPFKAMLATQVDAVGPADIVLQNPSNHLLGLSVKYQNDCTLNLSSKYFLKPESVLQLKKELRAASERFIVEMNAKYGAAANWFRQRKNSRETDRYIDKIRDQVIANWKEKSVADKKELLSKLVHADSPIPFWVIKYSKSKQALVLKININPITQLDPNTIELSKIATSSIGFKTEKVLLGKLQVKFNNGFLEREKGNSFDFYQEGIKMKIGDPFGSWNFSS